MEAFVKSLKNVHDKLCKGNIVHRDPSYILLSEDEYPVPVVEFEEMSELMMVSKEGIQQDKKVYDMLQDVISCMRDTGMIDSYLRLVFTRGLGAGMIANKLISNTIRSNTIRRDDYETRIGKLLFIKKRIDIITSLTYKRDPLHEEKDNERYGDMSEMLSRIEPALENLKVRFDKKQKAAMEIEQKTMVKEKPEESDGDTSAMSESSGSDSELEFSGGEGVQENFVKNIRIPSVGL